jgi:hypothetical protein
MLISTTTLLFCINIVFAIVVAVLTYLNKERSKKDTDTSIKINTLLDGFFKLERENTELQARVISYEKMKNAFVEHLQPMEQRVKHLEDKAKEDSDFLHDFGKKQSKMETDIARIQEKQNHSNEILQEIKELLKDRNHK